MDCDGKSESSPEREAAEDETKGVEAAEGVKKRKRKPYRPGMALGSDIARGQSLAGRRKLSEVSVILWMKCDLLTMCRNLLNSWNMHLLFFVWGCTLVLGGLGAERSQLSATGFKPMSCPLNGLPSTLIFLVFVFELSFMQ